ncbi:MAG TPA: PAS domain S-box protein [Syntrophorhabdales bacterium]|nr:PAS domain S-box protein [Syntrophorhabdales bacterium]
MGSGKNLIERKRRIGATEKKAESSGGRPRNKVGLRQKRDPLAERVRKLLSGPAKLPDEEGSKDFDAYQIELKLQHEALRVADKTIREAQARYADLYDFAPVGYFTFDRGGFVKEANLTAAALLGFDVDFLIAKPFTTLITPFYVDIFRLDLENVFQKGSNRVSELEIRRKNGTTFFASMASVPVRNATGIVECRSAIIDVTEHKEIERALAKSEERLKLALEASGQAVWDWNLVTGVVEWSEKAKTLFGFEPNADVAYNQFLERVHSDDRDRMRSGVLRALEEKEEYNGEARVVWPDGAARWLTAKGRFFYDESGKPLRMVGVASDITDRKLMEAALREARDGLELRVQERTAQLSTAYEVLRAEMQERQRVEHQLRESQKMEAIGTLAGGIAHDFNNILAAIIGFTEMVIDDVSDRTDVQQKMEQVLKAGLRGRELVRQILTFSRKSKAEYRVLTLGPLIRETFRLLRASLPTSISMSLNLEADQDSVYADPSQIQQVLMNLCTNASYAMRETGGKLEISLGHVTLGPDDPSPEPDTSPGEYVVLSVRDTGTGMSEAVKEHIFEPFFTTRPRKQASGLGLSVVYGIVKSHKGSIMVLSQPGKGSVFRVFLPKADLGESTEEETSRQPLREKRRILFVDDEEIVAEMGRFMLGRIGYDVVVHTDSGEALRSFTERPGEFDLVITDQTMPKMTGVVLAEKLLQIRPDIPIILCTGYSDLVSDETARAKGIKQLVMKPLARKEMAELIQKVLPDAHT